MVSHRSLSMVALSLFAASVANAGLSSALAFSFADPVPGRQLHNVLNTSTGLGTMTYDTATPIAFYVDGSQQANAFDHMFVGAHLEMNFTVGTGTWSGRSYGSGTFNAGVSGGFSVRDANGDLILSAVASQGALLRFGGSNSIILSSDTGLTYTFGAALNALLAASGNAAQSAFDPQEGVFTLTDALAAGGGSNIVNTNGTVKSFDANASYSGNTLTTVVPAPGALAVLGVIGLVSRRRRA